MKGPPLVRDDEFEMQLSSVVVCFSPATFGCAGLGVEEAESLFLH